MKCVQQVSGLLLLSAVACGGSSSETPMPLEPLPHTGPEPVIRSQKAPVSDEEETETPSEQQSEAATTPAEPQALPPVAPSPDPTTDNATGETGESEPPVVAPENEEEAPVAPTPK